MSATPSLPKRQQIAAGSAYRVSPSARHNCRMCAHGCRNYDVMLTETEARRLSLPLWREIVEPLPGETPLVVLDAVTGQFMLNKREDGRCVFLDADNLCAVHKASGVEAKPTACQFFPLQAVQAPDGIHLSLNTGCRRLVEMTDHDAPLDGIEGQRLLSGVQAVTTLGETVLLTAAPETTEITYAEFLDWQLQLEAVLCTPDSARWIALRDAAQRLLTVSAPTNALTDTEWQSVYRNLAQHIAESTPERKSLTALYARAEGWLPFVLSQPTLLPVALHSGAAESALCARLARQFLDGRQAALHRSALSGWTAILAAEVAAHLATPRLAAQTPAANSAHVFNGVLSDAHDLWFTALGQAVLTDDAIHGLLSELAQLSLT